MYIERVTEYLHSILPGMGYELDSVTFTKENGTEYLRAFIFRADGEGMTVDDCAAVSRSLSAWLDEKDFIEEEYMLEVCSLGFKDRPGDENAEEYTETASEEAAKEDGELS